MAEFLNQNPLEIPTTAPAETVSAAPPPPPEVKVRTMRSDVALLAKSGGGLPRFESVKIAGLPSEGGPQEEAAPARKKIDPLFWGLAAVAALVLGTLVYFIIRKFF